MTRGFGIIIQARIQSQRLPNKVIMPVYKNYSILDIVSYRIKKLAGESPVIIASGDREGNYALKQEAEKNQLPVFFGEENDVLKRFIDCSQQYGLTRVMRICCDNPFIDTGLVRALIDEDDENADYVSYLVNGKPAILSHYGFFAEIISVKGLVDTWKVSADKMDREHVTRYIYTHPGQFQINLLQCPAEIENETGVRLTVDTPVDFANAAGILENLMENRVSFDYSYKDVLGLVKKNGRLLEEMKLQIKENSK
jgi:spore coat polysaccharide biosynthesis protein SpsF